MEKEKTEKIQSKKERGLEHHKFLETMLKILLPLKQIKSTQIEKAYDMTAEDHGFELSAQEKESLFGFMKNIKQIVDVKDPSQKHEFDMMGVDQNGKLCIVDWKTGKFDSKRYESMNNYVQKNVDIKIGFIVYLDLDQTVEIKKATSTKAHTEEKKIDENPNEVLKQAKNEEKEEQENDLAALGSILKDKELHSKGLKNDYGPIKYTELLRKLVDDPKMKRTKDGFLGLLEKTQIFVKKLV